ncbi:MAG: DUF5677 domain-containing protein [Steroidobacteraceae bacterium]
MALSLGAPNTHALRDPGWARDVIRHYYAQQLDLHTDVVAYAADLALRALASAPDGIPHHMVISVLFRQAIAAADAAGELLRWGAVDQAHLQMRALIEARWGLIYALRDPDKWGRYIYVSSLRQNRYRARRWIVGTPEYKAAEYERELRAKYGSTDNPVEGSATAQQLADGIDEILRRPDYVAVSDSRNSFYASRGYEAPWYFDGTVPSNKQITSIRKLAQSVGALGEYDSVYSYASDHTHGGYTGTHLAFDDMGAYVAHVRTPEGLRQTLILSFSLISDCCRRAIEQWRPGESERFVRTYVEKWRELLRQCPEVVVERSRAANR